ncbi:hypothetical protein [Nostoc sp. LPT]|uniref:hypothetical protein n=1 Tax=Nostoc sp. LPT TaxID=2815387 RepID=UPI001DAFB45D|nr:hypothetical protein [Nostoc sp. LPT]MBN4000605.1 hypothetical protein [Nostoc sp. LPT]
MISGLSTEFGKPYHSASACSGSMSVRINHGSLCPKCQRASNVHSSGLVLKQATRPDHDCPGAPRTFASDRH